MKIRFLSVGWLIAVFLLGTGASTEGARQAREWQHAGDMAMAGGLLLEAHAFYSMAAETFPGTRIGRYAQGKADWTRKRLRAPGRSPTSESFCTWAEEVVDFFTWP